MTLTVRDLMQRLSVGKTHATEIAHSIGYRVGKLWRIDEIDLEAWIGLQKAKREAECQTGSTNQSIAIEKATFKSRRSGGSAAILSLANGSRRARATEKRRSLSVPSESGLPAIPLTQPRAPRRLASGPEKS